MDITLSGSAEQIFSELNWTGPSTFLEINFENLLIVWIDEGRFFSGSDSWNQIFSDNDVTFIGCISTVEETPFNKGFNMFPIVQKYKIIKLRMADKVYIYSMNCENIILTCMNPQVQISESVNFNLLTFLLCFSGSKWHGYVCSI